VQAEDPVAGGVDYVFAAGTPGLNYKIVTAAANGGNGTVTLEGFADNATDKTTLTIPATVEYGEEESKLTYDVVGIAAEAFKGVTELTSATFAGNIKFTSIGDDAFAGCTGLTTVTLSKETGLTALGNGVFKGATSLTALNLDPATVGQITSIGDSAFAECSLLTAGDLSWFTKLESIGKGAYANSGLTTLWLPESLVTIEEGAFAGTPLTEAKFLKQTDAAGSSENLESIGKDAFKDCKQLTTVTLNGSAAEFTGLASGVFSGCTALTTLNLDLATVGQITSIGDSAFAGSGLTAGDLSWFTKLESIGKGTYANSGLKGELWLPESLVTIEEGAFAGTALTKAKFLKHGDGGNADGDGTKLASIGKDAFKDCKDLTTVQLNATSDGTSQLTKLENGVFSGCEALTTLTIGLGTVENIESIGANAFADCKALEAGDLSWFTELTTIGEGAYAGSGLTGELSLPASLETIGNGAFANCEALETVTLTSKEPPTLGAGAFEGIKEGCVFEVEGDAFLGAYQDAAGWKETFPVSVDGGGVNGFKFISTESTEEGTNGTAVITGYRGFTGGELKIPATVTIPAHEDVEGTEVAAVVYDVIEIADGAFNELEGLTGVTFFGVEDGEDGKLATIGAKAFAGTGLTKVSFPASLEEIGGYAFAGCEELAEVAVPAVDDEDSIAELGENVFEGVYAGCVFIVIGDDESGTSFGKYSDKGTSWSAYFKDAESAYGFTFEVDKDGSEVETGTVTITGVKKDVSEVTIPERVTDKGKAYDVAGISKNAFKDVEALTVILLSVEPPVLVTEDGEEAVAIPNENVTFICPEEALFAYQTSVWWPYVELPVYAFTFDISPAEEVEGEEEGPETPEEPETPETLEVLETPEVPKTEVKRTATVTGVNLAYYYDEEAEEPQEEEEPELTEEKELAEKLAGVTKMTITEVVIYKGKVYTVTAIKDGAFAGCTGLKTFTLESATPPALGEGVFAKEVTAKTCDFISPNDEAYQEHEKWKVYFPTPTPTPEPEPSEPSVPGEGGSGVNGGFRVSFYDVDGTRLSQTTIAKGDTVPADKVPALEAREGYTLFWYAGRYETNIWDFSSPVTAVLELHALWVEDEDEDDDTGVGAVIGGGNGAVALYNLRGQLVRKAIVTRPTSLSALREDLGVSSGIYILATPEGSRKVKL
jgi:hypothetical protein